MKKNGQIADELLVKYLLGEATDAEINQVMQWKNESAANKSEFDSFRLIWEQSKLISATSTVNENDAWARFSDRLAQPAAPAPKQIPLRPSYKWLKVAAVLLLLAGGSYTAWYNSTTPSAPDQAIVKQEVFKENLAVTAVPSISEVPQPVIKPQPVAQTTTANNQQLAIHVKQSGSRQIVLSDKEGHTYKNDYTKESLTHINTNDYLCNNTPYPFEICIIQTVKCNNEKPSAVSTCSVIEPDQSGRLHYKAFDKIAKNCKTTIDEIRITKINTGETIVLNDHSTPSTAQNFFNHLTGKQKGDVFAGMFHSDCDEESDNCGLSFDSNFGNFILQ